MIGYVIKGNDRANHHMGHYDATETHNDKSWYQGLTKFWLHSLSLSDGWDSLSQSNETWQGQWSAVLNLGCKKLRIAGFSVSSLHLTWDGPGMANPAMTHFL